MASGSPPDAGLTAIASASAAAADHPARPGPLAVRTFDHQLFDARRGRTVPVRVHLPEGDGPCPIIVFSHGLGGSRLGYGYLSRSWASYGYAVLHPTHAGSDSSLLRAGAGSSPLRNLRAAMQDPANWEARARDLSFLLDSLALPEQALPALAGRLDPARTGVAGHSFGGYTAAALAGALIWFPFPGGDAPRPAREAQKALLEEATLGFWDGFLLGRPDALQRLRPEALVHHESGPADRAEVARAIPRRAPRRWQSRQRPDRSRRAAGGRSPASRRRL